MVVLKHPGVMLIELKNVKNVENYVLNIPIICFAVKSFLSLEHNPS